MKILTNSRKTYGACSILYPEVLEQVAEQMEGDIYLIPSSVHEMLALPKEQERSGEELQAMIAEVNSTEISPEEVLSDHLYFFSRKDKEIRML